MSARTRVLATLAVCAGALLAAASPASASVTCSNAASTLTIAHPDGIDDITVRVDAGTIAVLDDGAALACAGPVPTTGNIGALAYSHTGGIADVIFEEPDRLAPGNGMEASLEEINVTLTETLGILSDVILRDADGLGDSMVIGAGGINFNGDADADIVVTGFSTNFVFEGGAGADLFDARGGTGTGAAFADRVTLRGGGGNDQLFGGADFDAIEGDGGNDTIDGGPDFDRLDGGPGNDAIAGGADRDEVDYSASTAPVNIDLAAAGPQNGGSLGMDTITGVENLLGSPEADVLRGDAADNDLLGERGDDLIEGRGGDDFLDGQGGFNTASFESSATPATVDLQLNTSQDTGSGMDTFSGGSFEALLGSAGADTLRGTNGINRIEGGPGADNIAALGGDDTVLARDGVGDTVDCGEGTDSGTFDRRSIDSAITSCELGVFAPEPDRSVRLGLSAKAQRLIGGAIAIRAGCGAEACRLTAGASVNIPGASKRLRFIKVRTRVGAGRRKVIRLRLKRADARKVGAALSRGVKLSVQVLAVARDAAGNRRARSAAVRLKR